jgi:hypothetical protein
MSRDINVATCYQRIFFFFCEDDGVGNSLVVVSDLDESHLSKILFLGLNYQCFHEKVVSARSAESFNFFLFPKCSRLWARLRTLESCSKNQADFFFWVASEDLSCVQYVFILPSASDVFSLVTDRSFRCGLTVSAHSSFWV